MFFFLFQITSFLAPGIGLIGSIIHRRLENGLGQKKNRLVIFGTNGGKHCTFHYRPFLYFSSRFSKWIYLYSCGIPSHFGFAYWYSWLPIWPIYRINCWIGISLFWSNTCSWIVHQQCLALISSIISYLRRVMRRFGMKTSSFQASTVCYNQIMGATASLSSPHIEFVQGWR